MSFEAALDHAHRIYEETDRVLRQAVVAIKGPGATHSPSEVFEETPTVRSDGRDIGPVEEEILRSCGAKLGIGQKEDVLPSALPVAQENGGAYHVMVAGGKLGGKLEAQVDALSRDRQPGLEGEDQRPTGPLSYWFFGSNKRKLTGDDDERRAAAEHGFSDDATEIDAVAAIARTLPGFVGLAQAVDLSFSYDYTRGHETSQERSGLLRLLGHVAGRPVLTLAAEGDIATVDGKTKITNAPEVPDLFRLVDAALNDPQVLAEAGIDPTLTHAPAVLVESATYAASRRNGAALVTLSTGRQIDVAAYGTETFARIKNRPVAAPPERNQLSGEFRKIDQWNRALGKAIAQHRRS